MREQAKRLDRGVRRGFLYVRQSTDATRRDSLPNSTVFQTVQDIVLGDADLFDA
jgi:hypothetical protein